MEVGQQSDQTDLSDQVAPDQAVISSDLSDLNKWSALTDAVTKLNEELRYPDGRTKVLIEYEFYCRICKLYWSECSFKPFKPKCKNNHETVRLLAQNQVFADSYDDTSFDNIYSILYNEDGGL